MVEAVQLYQLRELALATSLETMPVLRTLQ